MTLDISTSIILIIFVLGYLAIIFEFYIKVNKTAVGIALAGICWMIFFINNGSNTTGSLLELGGHLSDISQIIFFLLGAMTLVELIDSHKGFNLVLKWVNTRSKKKLLILISLITFFLSAILDNLTTTILMLSILRKLIPCRKDRLALNCMVVIAANSGGAWTPIGDVTTTMLWINNYISTTAVMSAIFLPSIISMAIPLCIYMISAKGRYPELKIDFTNEQKEPGAKIVFVLGILALVSVPIIKWLTGVPPFIGMLSALALLWFVTDIIHYKYEDRQHLRIPFILTKVDVSSVLFFLGILLSIDALESVGFLKYLAVWLGETLSSPVIIATFIGILSAIIDNVPLVAAAMGMYDISVFPMNSHFWLLIAFTAGTGGSILSIGSAAGVALMGIEKVDFITYFKKAAFPAFLGYAGGIAIYLLIN